MSMAYRYSSHARLLAMAMVVSSILLFSLPRAGAVACTAKGLATGLESCLSSAADKDDCCDYLINDIVYPCGITEVCGLELGSEVREFFDYCRFKCHGLRPRLSASS